MIFVRSFSGTGAGIHIQPKLWTAKECVYVCSPWISADYAAKLGLMANKGTEVRVITSDDDLNADALGAFREAVSNNLKLLVIQKDSDEGFIHSKLYVIDREYAVTGSANLTRRGLYDNVESLNIFEEPDDVAKIELEFSRLWMKFDKGNADKNIEADIKRVSIRGTLPVNVDYAKALKTGFMTNNEPKKIQAELEFLPFYLFEYSFRGGPQYGSEIFEGHGFVAIDAVNRTIHDSGGIICQQLASSRALTDCKLSEDASYSIKVNNFNSIPYNEAERVALDHISKINTHEYMHRYKGHYYNRVYVPASRDIRFLRNCPVYVPVWNIGYECGQAKCQTLLFATSGDIWKESMICPECNGNILPDFSAVCSVCGKRLCSSCIKKKGIFDRTLLCARCKKI